MSALSLFKRADGAVQQTNDLDELLRSTERYGEMALSRMDNGGWWARIDMRTNAAGAKFRIESEYSSKNPQTPLQAVQQCIERINAALKTLGSSAT